MFPRLCYLLYICKEWTQYHEVLYSIMQPITVVPFFETGRHRGVGSSNFLWYCWIHNGYIFSSLQQETRHPPKSPQR